MDSGEESEVEVSSRDGEGEFSGKLLKKRGRFTIPENDESEEDERIAAERMKRLFSKKLESKKIFLKTYSIVLYEMLHSFGDPSLEHD